MDNVLVPHTCDSALHTVAERVLNGGNPKMRISEEIIPKDCALFVESSPEEFAKGITFLLDNPEIGKEMGERARERIVRFHDWDILAHKYQKALREVLK